jgi:hypothetical protein
MASYIDSVSFTIFGDIPKQQLLEFDRQGGAASLAAGPSPGIRDRLSAGTRHRSRSCWQSPVHPKETVVIRDRSGGQAWRTWE